MTITVAAVLTTAWCALAAPARAQTWTDRAYLNADIIYQTASSSFSDTVHPIEFGEAADITTNYQVKGSPGFDVGGGVRVWRNLAVGAAVSLTSKTGSGAINAQIPHPLYFNRPRTVAGDAGSLARDETAVHVQLVWMRPFRSRWQLALSGGPSWIEVKQDLVSDVLIAQAYPFDVATVTGVVTHSATGSGVGFNAAVDLSWMVVPHVGLGAVARYSHATVSLPAPNSDNLSVDAGGAQLGAGIRFRF